MKKIISLSLLAAGLLLATYTQAQADKSKRPSPPARVTRTISSGATVTIDYSQPSLKGRTIGVDVEPMEGKVWRMGANEATIFETDKDVKINGELLPAGKYSLFGIQQEDGFTLIFNKEWKIWGTQYEDNKEKDVLHVLATLSNTDKIQEKLTYTIEKDGEVSLLWGNRKIEFKVQ